MSIIKLHQAIKCDIIKQNIKEIDGGKQKAYTYANFILYKNSDFNFTNFLLDFL